MGGRRAVVQRHQPGLSDEQVSAAVLEQLEWLIRPLDRVRVSAQADPAQIAAHRVNLGLEQVGGHPHSLAAAERLRTWDRARRRCNGWHILAWNDSRRGGPGGRGRPR